ncbi:alkaline phosphatase family protein [Azospirillum sp. B4]|uniref:alkaline phosphatase family protein n=1 Tax=Azospirillum sp. B4 TaxID=95605 RepID=UPI00034525B0|nr:alkaline phosphatase family protein [Azospirillum sp. B4]
MSSIKHVVQLMLENRSFDQMLGFLYEDSGNRSPAGHHFEGLTGRETNPDGAGNEVPVFKIGREVQPSPYFMPGGDPGEGFFNTNVQLFSTENPPDRARPENRGFVVNFRSAINYDNGQQYMHVLPGTAPNDIMGMFTPDLLPVLSGLARGYAVCDRWFASVPTQTIPNRCFAAAATSQGHLDNKVKTFTCPSIFGQLSRFGVDWAIFGYNQPPMTRLDYPDTRDAPDSHFGLFTDFQARARAGTLPAYTFLEPDFSYTGNSQHPNYDVALGEQLIHDVYYTLRDSPCWNETLLVITYDEHGGCYDHVPPPYGATPPDDTVGEFDHFDFRRFGVRVPAVLISPLIEPGTVFRADHGTIDHTSVLKTIEERWTIPPLTRRDAAAPSLADVLTRDEPRTDDPLAGVVVPTSGQVHPGPGKPSALELVHAQRLADLPVANAYGTFDHQPPDLSTAAAVADYIRARTAAWKQHKARRQAGPIMATPRAPLPTVLPEGEDAPAPKAAAPEAAAPGTA